MSCTRLVDLAHATKSRCKIPKPQLKSRLHVETIRVSSRALSLTSAVHMVPKNGLPLGIKSNSDGPPIFHIFILSHSEICQVMISILFLVVGTFGNSAVKTNVSVLSTLGLPRIYFCTIGLLGRIDCAHSPKLDLNLHATVDE